MKRNEIIFTIDLFPKIEQKLIELLKSLSVQDWQKPTVAPLWKVKDVAAHLLDGNIRGLSIARDAYSSATAKPAANYADLITYLNRLNADWVLAMQRVSSIVLIELLEITGKQYFEYLKILNPFEEAVFPVAWAGEEKSANWFHIAREYTEKWHHQQQIRLAVGQTEALLTPELYYPYLATSMQALPFHYKNNTSKMGSIIKFNIKGNGGGVWFLQYNGFDWELVAGEDSDIISEVVINSEIAWLIFTKGISKIEAAKQIQVEGDEIGGKIVEMLAVMA